MSLVKYCSRCKTYHIQDIECFVHIELLTQCLFFEKQIRGLKALEKKFAKRTYGEASQLERAIMVVDKQRL